MSYQTGEEYRQLGRASRHVFLRFIAFYIVIVLTLFGVVIFGTAYAMTAHNINSILVEAIWANSCIIIPFCSAFPAWLGGIFSLSSFRSK